MRRFYADYIESYDDFMGYLQKREQEVLASGNELSENYRKCLVIMKDKGEDFKKNWGFLKNSLPIVMDEILEASFALKER